MIHRREMAEALGQLFAFDHGFRRGIVELSNALLTQIAL
jgi:hypothetical protein